MNDGEWKIVYDGVDYTFGTGASLVWNQTAPDLGDVELAVADVDRPRADGRAFGTDYRGGRTITFDLGVRAHTESAVRDEVATLARIWRADPVRLTPGAVAELHACYAGRERVMFGRPRKFAPNTAEAAVNGYATVQATFDCLDDLFYGAAEGGISFGVVGGTEGGLLAPLASPLSTTANSDRSVGTYVDSELPVWPVVEIFGPVTNPVVTVAGAFSFEVRVSLNYDESVVLDTRPWARSALRNGTANVAGSVWGTRLSKASIPAGSYEVGMKGIDPTGTARVHVSWRPTYTSL